MADSIVTLKRSTGGGVRVLSSHRFLQQPPAARGAVAHNPHAGKPSAKPTKLVITPYSDSPMKGAERQIKLSEAIGFLSQRLPKGWEEEIDKLAKADQEGLMVLRNSLLSLAMAAGERQDIAWSELSPGFFED